MEDLGERKEGVRRKQKNDRNKVTVSGKSVEGGNEGKVCTCWRNDDVKRGRDERERECGVGGE